MPTNFIISGFPRSGTAFLSQVCNLSDRILCLHEGIVEYDDPFDFLSKRSEYYTGESSSFCLFPRYDSVNGKRVLIERDAQSVSNSLSMHCKVDYDSCVAMINEMIELKERFKAKFDPLVVPYEDLFKVETLKNIWTFLFPDLYFPELKVKNLTHIRCNRKSPSRAEMESIKPDLIQRLWLGLEL